MLPRLTAVDRTLQKALCESINIKKRKHMEPSETSTITEWQSQTEDAKSRGKYLLEKLLWSDCQLLVGEPSDQEIVKAHKLYLVAASPYFEKMFYGDWAGVDDVKKVPNIKPDIFKALLRYIYADEINLQSVNEALDLYSAADFCAMLHLRDICAGYIKTTMGPNNVCTVYENAERCNDTGLMEDCLKMIRYNTKEILNNESFMEVDMNTIIIIFNEDQLNISSELDLLNALKKYVNYYSNRPYRTEPEENNQGASCLPYKLDSRKVKEAVKHIRFSTLTPQQFAEGSAESALFTDGEQLAIFKKLSSPNNPNFQMPPGFSTIQQSRQQSSRGNIHKVQQLQERLDRSGLRRSIATTPQQFAEGSIFKKLANNPNFQMLRLPASKQL